MAAFNSTQLDDAVWISNDGLTAYLSSTRSGGPGAYDIFVATRASTSASWGAFTVLTNVNSTSSDRSPVVTPDGLTLFFYSDRGGNFDIYASTKPNLLSDFSAPASVAGVNSANREDTASISSDGKTLYFDSDRSGNTRMYRSTLGANGAFMAPQEIGELNTGNGDAEPIVSDDGLTLYFQRRISGNDWDVYVAHRSTTADGFGAPTAVAELNTSSLDGVTWLSADGCTVYLVSDRANGNLDYDLYVATRGQ